MRIKNWLFGCLLIPASFAFSAIVFAHAHLHEAEPAQGSVVRVAPARVVLHFSESLEPALCKVEVKNAATGQVVSEGKPKGTGGSTLEVSLKPLGHEKATYEVTWKAVSKDTHKMSGAYKFTFDPK